KQTMVNGERFITNELKEMEDKVLMAEERRRELEYSLFQEVIERIAKESERIKRASEIIGIIDTLCALAQVAEENDYLCPEVNDGNEIDIRDGRHPVVEKTIKDEEFVPNDIRIDLEEQQVLLITGPNMAGKSTILRQTALIVLMAQIGSFVPASRAKIGLVDRIFTRIGASDDLSRGQSTFMIEMTETANILRNATHRSLAILDEIGRGTSTYDGISIAWAVAEYLHDKRVRTLFATHYHELTELALIKPRIRNFNVGVKESGDRIIFIRKLLAGATNRSYGIHVAKIAGLPDEVIEKAEEILSGIESRSPRRKGSIVLNSYLRKKEKKENKEHSNLYNQLFLFPTK
ncbi:MAG: DNA mismatch repair protein MutS, partial [Deltaproteobacteria bacterium]